MFQIRVSTMIPDHKAQSHQARLPGGNEALSSPQRALTRTNNPPRRLDGRHGPELHAFDRFHRFHVVRNCRGSTLNCPNGHIEYTCLCFCLGGTTVIRSPPSDPYRNWRTSLTQRRSGPESFPTCFLAPEFLDEVHQTRAMKIGYCN